MGKGKTKKLINAWLQFMDLEENQKIEVALPDCMDSKEDEWSLKGNMLLLSEDFFKHIKTAYEKEHASSNADKVRSLYVTFPTYVNYKKNRVPLFGFSLDDIVMGDYSEDGWDLSKQPSFSAMRNIVDSFDVLTEHDASELDGGSDPLTLLSVIVSQYFSKSIRSLSELYNEIGSFTKRKQTMQLYLFWRSDTVVAKNLKADLSDALKTDVDAIPLVDQVLYGKLPKDPGQRFAYGRLGKVPAKTQREALIHQYNHPLTVVQGPPGSGKTTLIMNAIASYVIQSYLGQRSQLPVVITSSTNKAVDNVRDKFRDMKIGDYYLELGNVEKSRNAKQLIASTIEVLQSSTNQDELQRKIEDKRSKITDITSKLWGQTNQNLEKQSHVGLEIQQLEQEIEKLNEQTAKIVVPDLTLSDFDEGLKYLQALVSQLQGRGIVSKLFRGKGLSIQEVQLGSQAMSLLQASGAISGTNEILTVNAWIQLWKDIKSVRDKWVEKSENEQRIIELGKKLADSKLTEQKLKETLGAAEQTLYTDEVHTLQERLFYEILELNRLIAERNKQSVIPSLTRYQEYLAGAGTVTKDDLYWVFMCFPCIGTTLHSFRRCFPFASSIIGKLIVDEAGMISINQLFPAVCRAETMLVVGDTKQLEPVVTVAKEDQEEYRKNAFYAQGLSDEDYYAYSPLCPATATAHHVASGVTRNGESGEIGLKEHFRCVPPLARCFDEIASYDLTILKDDINTPFGSNLLGYHVDGHVLPNYTNPTEAQAVLHIMDHLLSNGYSLNDIGIISPFRNHKDALKAGIAKKYQLPIDNGFVKEQIGTVHTFQGAERRVILFSTVIGYGSSQGLRMFDKPNLLNVAISRAQELFILIGNTNVIQGVKNHYLDILLKHIRNNGKLVNLPEPIQQEPHGGKTRLIQNCQHITMMERAIMAAKSEVVIVAPWLRQQPVEHFLRIVKVAPYRPKVHVIYGYDKYENSEDIDNMKDFVEAIKNTGGSVQNCATGKQRGTHEKIMIVDRNYAIVGSWNWLSHGYGERCKEEFEEFKTHNLLIRNETSVLIEDKNVISKLLSRFEPYIDRC